MRIALDATYSVGPNLSGVGVYSREMLTRIPALHPEAEYKFCYRPHRFWKAPQQHRTLLWRFGPRGADIFHSLNQRVDARRGRRVVTTFHDLFVLTGEYSTPEFRQRFAAQARNAAQRSDLIIAVSQFTAGQVEDLLGVERSRIRVVYHGIRAQVAGDPGGRDKTILFVGAIQKRKNVSRLVQAFEQTAPGWRLVLAGSDGFGAEEIRELVEQSPRRADIALPGYVSDQELERLYGVASIFAFPSLDEGFGIPVIEAMALGIPVLTSNGSALAEIAGRAALLVDPQSVGSIAEGLTKLVENPELRNTLAAAGQTQAEHFRWDRAAQQTWGVYQELT